MKVGIIGSGLQCKRRASALQEFKEDSLVAISSNNEFSLKEVAATYNSKSMMEPIELFRNEDIEAVIITTPPSSHMEYMALGLDYGKKVLVEKPITHSFDQIETLRSKYGDDALNSIKCGFNHRFHPAIKMLREYLLAGTIGDPIFARSIYGIAARPDYPNEWRADPLQAAGGQFVEQGSHILDLYFWLLGDIEKVFCSTSNRIFENQALEDGGMAILHLKSGIDAQMHTTLGQWHNRFSLEIFGTDGFLAVDGLGNTYGTEILSIAPRDEDAPFNARKFEFRGLDKSWIQEWKAFKGAFAGEESQIGTFSDGARVMRVAESAYKSNISRTEVEVNLW
jgi:predicted dehydrogenase